MPQTSPEGSVDMSSEENASWSGCEGDIGPTQDALCAVRGSVTRASLKNRVGHGCDCGAEDSGKLCKYKTKRGSIFILL